MSRQLDFNAALMRADNFIMEQMSKFEHKRRRPSSYAPMSNNAPQPPYGNPPYQHQPPPPRGPPAPQGWVTEFDQRNQRWFYVDTSTGRGQWEHPSQQQRPQRAQTDHQMAQRLQREEEERARGRHRVNSQPPPPNFQHQHNGHLAPRPNHGRQGSSASPHPSPSGRLPPGAHLDMKTVSFPRLYIPRALY